MRTLTTSARTCPWSETDMRAKHLIGIEDGDIFVDESGRTHTVGVVTRPQTGWALALNERRKK